MKKLLTWVTCAAVALGVMACGGTAEAVKESVPETTASKTEEAADADKDNKYEKTGIPVKLRLGHAQPSDSITNKAANDFAKLVEQATEGELSIQVYPDSTFGANADMVSGVESGDLDFFVSATAQFATQYKPISVVDAWYMFKDTDHLLRFYSPECEVYNRLMNGMRDAVGVDTLASFYYGARQMTANRTIKQVSDLNGMKMRVASDPMPTAFFKALGAVPTPVAYNETYLALQQKVADGEENPIISIQSMKFDEVQSDLALTYHQHQMFNFFLSVATEKEKLNENQLAVLRMCAQTVAEQANMDAIAAEKSMIEAERSKLTVTEPDLEEFRTVCQSIYPEFEETWGQGVADSIQKLAE